MKTTITMLKAGLVGLFLTGLTVLTFAQTQVPPGPIDPLGPGSKGSTTGTIPRGELFTPQIANFDNELTDAILFFNPDQANSFNLRASAIEDHEDNRGLAFTTYNWYYDGDGSSPSGTPLTDEHTSTLNVEELGQGYHVYRVQAFINPDPANINEELLCVSEETFTVFVLPQLGVGVTNTGADPNLLQYCESDASDQTNVILTANVDYDGYTADPTLYEFELKYTWYAVKSTNSSDIFTQTPADFPTIDPTKTNIENADLQGSSVTKIGTTDTFYPAISEIGSYKFFVEVEYTIKDRNYDESEVDPITDRARPYVIYRGWFGGEDQEGASVVLVTPQPGKPHITIEAVND